MNDIKFIVEFYEDESGNYPVIDFIESLDNKKLSTKIIRDIELLEKHGNSVPRELSKHLKDGIFELRTKLGSNIVRTLYFFHKNKIIVITNAFVKKTQKTPTKEIDRAIFSRKRYLERIVDYD